VLLVGFERLLTTWLAWANQVVRGRIPEKIQRNTDFTLFLRAGKILGA
jgi:hypothetical protein